MHLRKQTQQTPVRDEWLALNTVVGPILKGYLHSVKRDVLDEAGGDNIKLKMLARLYSNKWDGDCGVCFEYAIHDAIASQDGRVLDKITDAAKKCKAKSTVPATSILFSLEKSGSLELIDTAHNTLTDESRLLHGGAGQPILLRKRLNAIARAFRSDKARPALPSSIRGLWKADLFIGFQDIDRWLGTTVKINERDLQAARGLRLAIVPAAQGKSDKVRKDEGKNLVICPLPHDQNFMEIFYDGLRIVQAFLDAGGSMPKERVLPSAPHRGIAKFLVDRADVPVVEVIDQAMTIFGQRDLLTSGDKDVRLERLQGKGVVNNVVAPIARTTLLV
jgi:hypothetical protein